MHKKSMPLPTKETEKSTSFLQRHKARVIRGTRDGAIAAIGLHFVRHVRPSDTSGLLLVLLIR